MSEATKRFFLPKDDHVLMPICAVHVCVFAYAFSYWICQPVEPYLLKKLGGDKMTYGYVQAACNVCLLMGGPIIGWICDKKGANVGALCTFAGGALSYFIQAVAWNVPMLFLAKVPYIFLHTMHCAQVCVSHLSQSDRRSEALGRLSMSYGIGHVVGSALGGFLGEHFTYQTNSWVACVVSLAMVPLMLCCVPTHSVLQQEKDSGESTGSLRFPVIFELLTQPLMLSLVVNSAILAISWTMYRYTFPNLMLYHFLLEPSEQGIVLAVAGAVGVISNVLLIGPALQCLKSHRCVVLTMSALLAACMVAFSFTGPRNLWLLYSLIVPKAAAGAVITTTLMTLFTFSVPAQQVGTAVAIAHAVGTAAGIVMPVVGNWIYVVYGFMVLGLTGAAILVVHFIHSIFAIGLSPECSESTSTTPLRPKETTTSTTANTP